MGQSLTCSLDKAIVMLVYLYTWRARLTVDDLYLLSTITRQNMRKKWSGFSRTCRTGSAGPEFIRLMELATEKTIKVAIALHQGDEETKMWRFSADSIRHYCRDVVEAEILTSGLRLRLYHFDEVAGQVNIESDGDMQEALTSFNEEWNSARRHDYLLLHAEEICPVDAAEPVHSTIQKKTRKVQATCRNHA